MNIFILLIGVSLLVALVFLGAFIWAVRDGQFDDNETPPRRILFDDDLTDPEKPLDRIDKELKT
jgi:cbb3-type cytochrome oxidase maturation protein